MLETRDLGRIFTSNKVSYEALKGVNLTINDGDCVAIKGKSGSGKSTLMHLLACLDTPTSGQVLLDSIDIGKLSEEKKNKLRNEKFGFVFQQFFLDGNETVFENVVLPLRIRGEKPKEIKRRGAEALAAVALSDKSGKNASDLSGGEKQRVCIARAIIGNPSFIFADEPTGNLDTVTGRAVEDFLLGLNRENGVTLIVVTHDLELASRCDRVIELQDGEIIGEGANSEVS